MKRPLQPERPLVGSLEGVDVPVLIRDVHRRAASGKLRVERRGVKRTVFFDEGRVIFVDSSDPNDRLGERLLRLGQVTVSQLEAVLTHVGSGKRLGTLMVEAGVLQQDGLVGAVVDQIRSVVLDLMTWTEGEYRFEECPPIDEDITLDLSTEELLFRGIREIGSMKLIERGVGTPRSVYRLSPEWGKRAETLDLTEGARVLIERLSEGPASVDALCREVALSNFEIFQTLWGFALVGVTEPTEPVPTEDHPEGRMGETGLAELLIRSEEAMDTGVLYVTDGVIERSLMFAAGRCVFATSSDADDGLVNFLFRRGVISLRDKEETVRRLLSNKRVGMILRELGAIDDADLQSMVRQQVSEIVYDTFSWEDGDFVFVPGSLPCAEEITLNCSASSLIAEGVRRIGSWTRLVRGCGGVDNPLCLTPRYLEILDSIEAGVAEWEVVNALKSPQTPRRVCAMCELDDFRVCQILWTLRILGAVEDSPIDVYEDEADTGEQALPQTVEPVHEPPVVAAPPPVEELPPPPEAVDVAPESPEPEEAPPQEAPAPDQYSHEVKREEVEQALRSLGNGESPEASEPGIEAQAIPVSADDGLFAEPEEEAEESGGNGDTTVPDETLPPGAVDMILRFNAMHRIVFRAVRTEIGAGAANFVRSCCGRVARDVPDPVDGVQLHADGSWDIEGLKRVILDKGLEDPWQFYQRVLDQEFVSLQPHLGDARAGELRQRIWEVQQAEPAR